MRNAAREWRAVRARLLNSTALVLVLLIIVSIGVWSVILWNEEQLGFRNNSASCSDEIPSRVIFPFQMEHKACLVQCGFERKLIHNAPNYLKGNVESHFSRLFRVFDGSQNADWVSGVICRENQISELAGEPIIFQALASFIQFSGGINAVYMSEEKIWFNKNSIGWSLADVFDNHLNIKHNVVLIEHQITVWLDGAQFYPRPLIENHCAQLPFHNFFLLFGDCSLRIHNVSLPFVNASLAHINGVLEVSDTSQNNGGQELSYGRKTEVPEAILAATVTGILWCLGIIVFYIGSTRVRTWARIACGLLGLLICVAAPFIGILGTFRFFQSLNVL